MQDERHFPGGLIALNDQIQVAIGDSKKGSGSGSSERRHQQDRCQLNQLSFVRESASVTHPIATQQLHEIHCI